MVSDSQCIIFRSSLRMHLFFECKPWPEPEPGVALAGLGSELGLEIYQARALESLVKATASRPSQAITSLLSSICLIFNAPFAIIAWFPLYIHTVAVGHLPWCYPQLCNLPFQNLLCLSDHLFLHHSGDTCCCSLCYVPNDLLDIC